MKINRIESGISVISGIITIGVWIFTVVKELGKYENISITFSIIITIIAMNFINNLGYYKGVKMSGKSLVTNESSVVTISVNFDKEYKNPPRDEIEPYKFKTPKISNLEVTTKGFTVNYYTGAQSNSFKNGIKWYSCGEL